VDDAHGRYGPPPDFCEPYRRYWTKPRPEHGTLVATWFRRTSASRVDIAGEVTQRDIGIVTAQFRRSFASYRFPGRCHGLRLTRMPQRHRGAWRLREKLSGPKRGDSPRDREGLNHIDSQSVHRYFFSGLFPRVRCPPTKKLTDQYEQNHDYSANWGLAGTTVKGGAFRQIGRYC
jgi:hypothetical protein